MRLRGVKIGVAIQVALAAFTFSAASAEAAPASGPHGTVDNRWTTVRPNAPTGFSFTGRYHAAGNPKADPPYMRRMTSYLPRGMRYDTTVPDRCTASDLELALHGASACPKGSRLGGGKVDTKFMGFPSTLDVDVLNNANEMIMVARSPLLSTITRGKIRRDGSVEFTSPTCFPSFDPPGCPVDTALQLGSSIKVPPYIRRSRGRVRSYATTPQECPRSRRWLTRIRFWWADGSGETITTAHPCRPPARRGGNRSRPAGRSIALTG